ncbi:hypothetical protein [Desulfonatronovibrio hydrogenovorans]|uniref:hypothetical protein n=1 Tax=Desulfonatronovibrio hydrogenovorans TaxID=53245 RepID=UPI00123732D9|nr:hypothetical protein [Desulfonatronovibrio hydrogenovorans]
MINGFVQDIPKDKHVCVLLSNKSPQEVAELTSLDLEKDWRSFRSGPIAWAVQLYLQLKKMGFPVLASNRPMKGCPNIAHVARINPVHFRPDHFLVAIMADRRPSGLAVKHVVQNKLQADDRHFFWMPHWPQPGLKVRNKERGSDLRVCAFAGREKHLQGDVRAWEQALAKIGIKFRVLGPKSWAQLQDIDCLVGIRTSNKATSFPNKPPTKLINAWLAGIPFIGGTESAYCQVGEPGKDYLGADTMQEALYQIEMLKNSPDLFNALVTRGNIKAEQFTHKAITMLWADFIWNRIWRTFEQWKKQPGWMRTARYLAAPGYRLFLYKKNARLKKSQ